MATADQITDLRRLIHELVDEAPWTDAALSARIDAHEGEFSTLAATIWREKAASFAGLIDVKEGSSDRKMSQLHQQALAMAEALGGSELTATARTSRTRKIERQ